MNKINFVIIGTGMIAPAHADAINSIERACLYGVCGRNSEKTAEFAKKYGVKCYNSYEEVLSDGNVDAVSICTPSGYHAEQAIQALHHGKNVIVEKPMALNTADCDRIIEAVKETGKTLAVICQLRFSEDVQRVKKLYEEGAFGTVSLCDLYMKYWREPSYYAENTWRGTKALDGGGALMNQGIHGIDLLLYITGGAKLISARTKTAYHNIEVEDTAVALLEYPNGAAGVIEGSTCTYPGFERSLEIHGSSGYVVLKSGIIEKLVLDGKDITPKNDDAERHNSSSDPKATGFLRHAKEYENFIAAINGEEELLIDACEGKKAVELIESIYETSADM